MDENKTLISQLMEPAGVVNSYATSLPEENLHESVMNPGSGTDGFPDGGIIFQQYEKLPSEDSGLRFKLENHGNGPDPDNTLLGTIQILADALPKIVPYVLIHHWEELLPLIMCAIKRHPDNGTRDSLTYTLFNLIKLPDGQQRQIIMDAYVSLAKNVGEMRTETELLPQCWEQVNHMYEECRLLVAQSCGELAELV